MPKRPEDVDPTLCHNCQGPKENPQEAQCVSCHNKSNKSKKLSYAQLKAEGKCPKCTKPSDREGGWCSICYQRNMAAKAAAKAKKKRN